jgi:hypothetical protein
MFSLISSPTESKSLYFQWLGINECVMGTCVRLPDSLTLVYPVHQKMLFLFHLMRCIV